MGPARKTYAVVYFAYVNTGRRWQDIVGGQLEDIARSGLLDLRDCDLHVVVCNEGPKSLDAEVAGLVSRHAGAHERAGRVSVTFCRENTFEYPGIALLHRLAARDPRRTYLYLHSKGMVFGHEESAGRSAIETRLTRNTLFAWRKAEAVLEGWPDVQKVGLFPAGSGHVWYNFFFARGTYLQALPEPVVTDRRHYYEGWLGETGTGNVRNAYSLFSGSSRSYDAPEAIELVSHLDPAPAPAPDAGTSGTSGTPRGPPDGPRQSRRAPSWLVLLALGIFALLAVLYVQTSLLPRALGH
jgi:hypothetical protein